ncbi:hypothetical Protein psc1_04880 [Candidatus Phytoplasma solani]
MQFAFLKKPLLLILAYPSFCLLLDNKKTKLLYNKTIWI